ncbi:MAG: hypothetical protein NTZ24_07945 [Deltaproteobacteria bacterium]|nr:hypothetical protein [Deltaproteobacteria bacterium]
MKSTTVKLGEFIAEKIEPFEVLKPSILIKTRLTNSYFDDVCEYWIELWRKQIGIKNPDFAGITPFATHPGYRPLIMPKHELITAQRLYDSCRELFNCWKYNGNSLDNLVVMNDRDPRKGSYVTWFRDRVEADEELSNLSGIELDKMKIPGITLLEREVMEYDYFNRTNGHLDVENMTICSGSRYLCGDLPRVRWDGEKFFVHWFFTDRANAIMRSRQLFAF